MKKYFLLAIYLLTMVSIYHYPILLPKQGKPLPIWQEEEVNPSKRPSIRKHETIAQKEILPLHKNDDE